MSGGNYDFFKGGGDMGERMRHFDWSQTPLGEPQYWPSALKTTISILLQSRFPMFLLWGPGYTQFYNDAYVPSFGTEGKHPAALGQGGRDCWQEAWDVLGPLLEQVRLGGASVWKEDQPVTMYRNGRMEVTYWTFSYSPVPNDEGGVGGVLSTCFETTEKVRNTEQLKESAAELHFAIEATELGVWDLNPSTGRFTANARLKAWFGMQPEEEIPLTLALESIGIQDRERVTRSIAATLEGHADGQFREIYTLIYPAERPRIVLAKGKAWFDANGKAYRFNGTLQDITEQRLAELAQKTAEARFRNVSDSSPTGLWLSDTGGSLVYLNKTLSDWTGKTVAHLLDAGWEGIIAAPDREQAQQAFRSAVQSRAHYEGGFRIQKADGSLIWCRAAGDPYYDEQGRYAGYAGFCMDIQAEKDMSDRLEEHSRQLLHFFETAPVAIAAIDREELRFRMANSFYAALVGRKSSDLVGRPLLEALPELAGQGFETLLGQVLETGIPYNSKEIGVDLLLEGRLERVYVDMVYQPHYDPAGNIIGVLVAATDVTAQVTARRVVEESEARFKSLVHEAPVATCLFVGPDMVVEVANDIMLSYWGKDSSVIGLPLREAVPELVGQPFLGILDRIFKNGETYSEQGAEAQLVVDGKLDTYYFDYTYKPLRNVFGEVYAIMDMAIEVTGQVVARRKLEESEQFARHIFYNSPVAKLVCIGPDMVLREANEVMLQLLDRGDEILNKPLLETIPDLGLTDFREKYRLVLETGEASYEYAQHALLSRNGARYNGYYDYIYKPLRNSAGQIYGVVCSAVDVTKEVTARQKIELAEASLRGAIELAELSTWHIDIANRTVLYSERMQEWLGVKGAVLNLDDSPRILPEDRERIGNAIRAAMDPGGSGLFDEIYTITHMINGQKRIIHASGRTVFDEHGNAVSISGTAQDITLQRELQATLESQVRQRTEELAASNEVLEGLNESLRRSNEELSQYAYVASHDLQEPLRKIRMFSGMLNSQEDMPAFNKNLLIKIEKSAERMTMLIRDLLEFSRLTNSDDARSRVNLNQVVQQVLNDFELLIADTGARVEAGILPVLPAIGLQMNQLFYNIIGNALKFIRPGITPEISIISTIAPRAEVEQQLRKPIENVTYYKISIRDNGIGFEEKYVSQIFEVFRRLHHREAYTGSGIGLAVCRRIVDNHHGYLLVDSRVNEGTAFHIVLPA